LTVTTEQRTKRESGEFPVDDQQPSGCAVFIALGICLTLVLIVSAIGGGISFLVAYLAGTPSILAYIGGGTMAFVMVWLTSPAGSALICFFEPDRASTLTRSFVAILMAFLGPFWNAEIVFVLAAVSAVGGALLFHWCEPLTGAMLVGTIFPLVGLFAGAAAGDTGRGNSVG
jgi:hypothetical protein